MISAAVYYTLYTSGGHAKISSYISDQVSKEIGQKVTLKIEDIVFSPSQVDATFLINDALRAQVVGAISPLDKTYDIKYHLTGDKIVYQNVNIKDKVDIKGSVSGIKDDFKLRGEGVALEGNVNFSLHHQPKKEKDIKLDLQKVNSAKVFELLGKKPLIGGMLTLTADLPLYSEFEKSGEVKVEIYRSGVYLKNIRQTYGLQLPDDFMLSGSGDIQLAVGQHTFNAKIESNVGNLSLERGRFIEVNKKLSALYTLDIAELSKLHFITKKRYGGKFVAQGELEYLDGLRLDGWSDSLDGKVSYYYEKGKLEAKLEALSLAKLFTAMHYPTIMIGDIYGKAEVDVYDNSAVINLRSKNLRFRRSSVIENIYKVSSVDISRELFSKTYFTASVERGIVFYDFKAENRGSYIYLSDAKMDSKYNTIETDFDVKMQGEEISGEIYGSLKSPKVKLDMGKYIEFKARKEIDEFFGMGTSDKVEKKLNNVDMNDVEGFMKGFF